MTALELLKKWRWHRVGKEFEKVVAGLIGLAVFFALFCGGAVGAMLRYRTEFSLKILLILAAALLALWSLFYFLGKRDNNLDYTAIDNNETPEISLLFYGG
ncbi:MAG: hypothetical protein PHI85_11100 [Victivallaceae bacterium]|nr:hypothetical protein [Victivallaceae bacterium]